MERIKDNIKRLLGNQKQYIKNYSFTFILIIIVTLIMAFQGFEPEHIEEFYTAMILTGVLVFVIEAIIPFKWYRIPIYIIAFLISVIAKEFIFSNNFSTSQAILIAGLYIFLFLCAMYKIIKNSRSYICKIYSKSF